MTFINSVRKELRNNLGFRTRLALITYRLGFYEHFLCKNKMIKSIIKIVYAALKVICIIFSCSDLPPKCVYIGFGLSIPHGFDGTKMNVTTKIGDKCTMFHNVTFGALGGKGVVPDIIIGNNVMIGAYAIILGECSIGDGCKIGAGTILINAKIPPNTTVVNKTEVRLIPNSNSL